MPVRYRNDWQEVLPKDGGPVPWWGAVVMQHFADADDDLVECYASWVLLFAEELSVGRVG